MRTRKRKLLERNDKQSPASIAALEDSQGISKDDKIQGKKLNSELLFLLNAMLVELKRRQEYWLKVIDQIQEHSATILEISIDKDIRVASFLKKLRQDQEALVVNKKKLHDLMKPLWAVNAEIIPIYGALDSLYDYMIKVSSLLEECQTETVLGGDTLHGMSTTLKGLIGPNSDTRKYEKSIAVGNAAVQDVRDMCGMIIEYFRKDDAITDENVLELGLQVSGIFQTFVDITQERHKIASKWVVAAVNDIELLQTKVESSLEKLCDDILI